MRLPAEAWRAGVERVGGVASVESFEGGFAGAVEVAAVLAMRSVISWSWESRLEVVRASGRERVRLIVL